MLRVGGYSFHPTGAPAIMVKEEHLDEEIPISKFVANDGSKLNAVQAQMMVDDNWAEIVEAEDEPEPEDEDLDSDDDNDDNDPEKDDDDEKDPNKEKIEDVEAHLNELVKDKEEDEAKQILQDWGKTRLDITVSKSNKVENMIAKLVESVE